MPNYSLVANSVFQPFTYQELAAPIDRQDAYFENLAEQYDKLSSQADVLEAMGANDRDRNTPTYAKYKEYSERLRNEADNLYRNGLNSESRMRLSELRRMYNTDIVPIQNAWAKREQEAQTQLKAQLDAAARGIDIRFSRNAADTPLQSYIENPNQTFRTINGQQLASEVANQFKGLESQIQLDRNGNPWIGKTQISPVEYRIITQKGMDFNQFSDFINNPDDPNYANIRGIINNTLSSHGISDFDERTQREMFGLASQGVAAGVGSRDMQMHTDPYAKAMLEYELSERAARAKEARAAKASSEADVPTVTSIGVGLTPTEDYRASNLKTLEEFKVGENGLNSRYFGRVMGQVNPIKIYEEAEKLGKKKTLEKYAKYGVKDILTKDQYKTLKSAGFTAKKGPTSGKYDDLVNEFNKSVVQKSRYSTNMSGYDWANDVIITNMRTRDKYGKFSGTSCAINDDGSLGKPESLKDLNLYSADNTKGNKITDIQYDPEHKGKIILQLTDGSLHIVDPGVFNSNLRNMIAEGERPGAMTGTIPAEAITQAITKHLNGYNKTKSKTDSKIE